jgi:hypothetical protein
MSLHGLMSATGDPSIFQLPNLNPDFLLEHPTGELEVSMGSHHLASFGFHPQSQEFTTFAEDVFGSFDFSLSGPSQPRNSPSSPSSVNPSEAPSRTLSPVDQDSDLRSFFPNEADTQRSLGAFGADMMQYLNLEPPLPPTNTTPTRRPRSPNTPPVSPVAQSKETASYQPPAGASKSSTRRVAASWKPSFAVADDESPIEATPRERWGVSAT